MFPKSIAWFVWFSLLLLVTGCADLPDVTTESLATRFPYAEFAYQPPNQFAGRVVSFQAVTAIDESSYDHAIEFLWDFGDNEIGIGSSVKHIYLTAGTYTVKLTTVNRDGNASTASKNIVIKAVLKQADPPPGEPDPPPPPPDEPDPPPPPVSPKASVSIVINEFDPNPPGDNRLVNLPKIVTS